MPAYVIVEVQIEDFVAYEEYKKLTPEATLAYDGKFIVRVRKQNVWKVTGIRSELLYWNFHQCKGRRNGGRFLNIAKQKLYVKSQ